MQALEQRADAAGHSYATMMEKAGEAVAAEILVRYGSAPVLVLAGPGNNGGDGLVCARYLHLAGAPVRVYLWRRRTDPAHDSGGHLARLGELGVALATADEDPGFALLRRWLDCRIVVDALLGTGANRPLEGQLAELLGVVAAEVATHLPATQVVAVDCASGLDCDTGAVSPGTLAPQLTVTFAHPKRGHYHFPGADRVGELVVADIGIASHLSDDLRVFVLTASTVRAWLPARPRNSHKGTYGKLMLVVGSEPFPGAAYLSCAAAGRAGAGLVTGAVPQPIWPLVAGRLAEATWLPLPVRDEHEFAGVFAPSTAATVSGALAGYDALVLGCGLRSSKPLRRFVDQLLRHPVPPAAVIDADGLNCLAQMERWPERLPPQTVLTPHPAEMARLCKLTVAEVLADRWTLALACAAAWNCVLLLKGPYTVVAHPDGQLAVVPVATPALATAGTGDVLAGTIGAFLAQGLDPFAAACVGAWVHGAAGLRCEQASGVAGVVASDLLAELPAVLRTLYRAPSMAEMTMVADVSPASVDDAGVVAM